jgi:hypothetical protein
MEMNARLSADLYVHTATGSPGGGGGGQGARSALASPHINGGNLAGAGSVGAYMHTYICMGVCVCACACACACACVGVYVYVYVYV